MIMPKYPGIFRPLSKQGLDAMIGKTINRIAGKFWNKAGCKSTVTINGWEYLWNINTTNVGTSNQPKKFKRGTP